MHSIDVTQFAAGRQESSARHRVPLGVPTGRLAKEAGYRLPVQVLKSAAGFYLGTADESGPVSRESVEYWPVASAAEQAMAGGEGHCWTQRQHP
jgi:hypothetical protein